MGHDLTLIVEIVYTRMLGKLILFYARISSSEGEISKKKKEKLKSHREIDKDETC